VVVFFGATGDEQPRPNSRHQEQEGDSLSHKGISA
jgi:hypothetical protein